MTALAVYARVSSDEQRRNETILTQVDFLRRYCDLHELPLATTYLDDGVSGTLALDHRPEGARLLTEALAGRVTTVLVYKIDRLGRSARHILNAVHQLEEAGCSVRSATEPFDTSNPSGRFLLTVLSGVAGYDRETTLARLGEAKRRLAREGVWLGGVTPYGYRVVGHRKQARLAIDEATAAVVREVYRLTTEEHRTCGYIADLLNAQGVSNGPHRWQPSRIRALLVTSAYQGVHVYRTAEPISRAVPALVDAATWQRAGEVLHEHQLGARRNAKRSYLLRGLVVCGICGRHYCGSTSPGREPAYRCLGALSARAMYGPGAPRCSGPQVPGAWIEAEVWGQVLYWLGHVDEQIAALALRRQAGQESSALLAAEASRLEAEAECRQDERDVVLDLYRRGRIGERDLDHQFVTIASEQATLRARATELRAREATTQAAEREVETAAGLLAACRALLTAGLDGPTRERLIRLLVRRIVVDVAVVGGRRQPVLSIEPVW